MSAISNKYILRLLVDCHFKVRLNHSFRRQVIAQSWHISSPKIRLSQHSSTKVFHLSALQTSRTLCTKVPKDGILSERNSESSDSDTSDSDSESNSDSSSSDEDKHKDRVSASTSTEKGLTGKEASKNVSSTIGKLKGKNHDFLSSKEEVHDMDIVNAVKAVARSLPGDENKTIANLLDRLQAHDDLTLAQARNDDQARQSINSIMSDMSIHNSKNIENIFPANQRNDTSDKIAKRHEIRELQKVDGMGKKGLQRSETRKAKVDGDALKLRRRQKREALKLYAGKSLGIFDRETSTESGKISTFFDILEEDMRQQQVMYPPTNAFEEQIKWTSEGKLWTFPINNELGMQEETEVGFHEHVFLEHLLDAFPKRGPIRHFMELVICGLSNNPYLTVQQKHDHVFWFEEYFKDKQKIIDEVVITHPEKQAQIEH